MRREKYAFSPCGTRTFLFDRREPGVPEREAKGHRPIECPSGRGRNAIPRPHYDPDAHLMREAVSSYGGSIGEVD